MNKRHTDNRRDRKGGSSDLLGIVIIIMSAFCLLCIIIPIALGVVGYFFRGIFLGVFGLFSYPLFLSTLFLGIALVRDLSFRVSVKNKVCIGIMAFCAMMILQLATSFSYIDGGFSYYISSVYSSLTAGGVLFGVLAYGLQAAVTQVFAYILLSTGIVVCALAMLDVFRRLGSKKEKLPVAEEPKRLTFEKSDSPARMVKPIENNGLFVGNIVKTNHSPVRTAGGDFSDMRDREPEKTYTRDTAGGTQFQGYNSVPEKYGVKPADSPVGNGGLRGGFEKYNSGENDNLSERERARQRLFGNRPAASQNYINQINSAINNGGYTPPATDTLGGSGVVTPSPVITPPEIKPARPPKIVHNDRQPPYEVVIPAPVDFSDSIVGGEIIDGEAVSQELAGKEKDGAKFDFGNGNNIKPATFKPLDKNPAENTSPIINGDFFGKTVTPKNPVPEQKPNIPRYDVFSTFEDKPKQIEPIEADDDIVEEEEWLAPIVDGSQYGNAPEDEFKQEELKSQISNLFSDDEHIQDSPIVKLFANEDANAEDEISSDASGFNYSDEVEDLSETSHTDEEDKTGYYTTDALPPIIKVPEPVVPLHKGKPNQMGISDIVLEPDEPVKPKPKKRHSRYVPPILELLECNSTDPAEFSGDASEKAKILEETLESLKLPAKVTAITIGPAVTRYELEVPPGTSVRKIDGFASDIEYNLASNGKIRIETPIPGKRAVGIEVPNMDIATVALRDLIECKEFQSASSPVTLAIGKDIAGSNVICNLEKMPHLLIAGATNSGKSACLNSIIASILYKASPDEVRLILIDPKEVEFRIYQDMPHLLIKDIISETDQAIRAFKWAKNEMDRRYKLLSRYYARNIQEFNSNACVKDGIEEKMPRIVIIVDELAELMMSANRKDLEDKIMSMAQKARAAGIHLILATQRPSVDVITGTIKANLPSRIAFAVTSFNDSRTILDQGGAESLLGRGDMLYSPIDVNQPKRVQGAYITGEELSSIVAFVKEHNTCDYDSTVEDMIMTEEAPVSENNGGGGDDDEEFDPLIKDVLRRVIETGQASTSMIQRRFSVGYARASRIIDQMEMHHFIGPLEGSNKPREVFITAEQFREIFGEDI